MLRGMCREALSLLGSVAEGVLSIEVIDEPGTAATFQRVGALDWADKTELAHTGERDVWSAFMDRKMLTTSCEARITTYWLVNLI